MDMGPIRDERDALRAQVAALTANGVSMHKAAAAERAAVVSWLRGMLAKLRTSPGNTTVLLNDRLMVDVGDLADAIDHGDHIDGAP